MPGSCPTTKRLLVAWYFVSDVCELCRSISHSSVHSSDLCTPLLLSDGARIRCIVGATYVPLQDALVVFFAELLFDCLRFSERFKDLRVLRGIACDIMAYSLGTTVPSVCVLRTELISKR